MLRISSEGFLGTVRESGQVQCDMISGDESIARLGGSMFSKTHSEISIMARQIFKLFTNMQYRGETIRAYAQKLSIFLAT